MKHRLFAVVIVFQLLFICACCDSGVSDFRLSGFQSDVSFNYNGTDYSGNLEFISADNITLTLNSPEHLNSFVFVYKSDKTSLIFDGTAVPLESLTLGQDIYAPLFTALKTFSEAEIRIKNDGTQEVLIGGNSEICVKISCNDMRIIAIESCGIYYNFQYN